MQRQSALSITRKEKNRPAKRKYCGTHKDQSRTVRQMPKHGHSSSNNLSRHGHSSSNNLSRTAQSVAKKKKWQMTTAKKHEYWTYFLLLKKFNVTSLTGQDEPKSGSSTTISLHPARGTAAGKFHGCTHQMVKAISSSLNQ